MSTRSAYGLWLVYKNTLAGSKCTKVTQQVRNTFGSMVSECFNIAVVEKVREWYDIGKLDEEKTTWELTRDASVYETKSQRDALNSLYCSALWCSAHVIHLHYNLLHLHFDLLHSHWYLSQTKHPQDHMSACDFFELLSLCLRLPLTRIRCYRKGYCIFTWDGNLLPS